MSWSIGDIQVESIYEQDLLDIEALIPQSDEYKHRVDWLRPNYMNERDQLTGVIQAFLVRTQGAVILVDTCVGNDKDREFVEAWHRLSGDFLHRLCKLGIDRSDVTHVLCTHMHPDHVGWNTLLEDGSWKPTFPQARYLFSETEFDYWATQLEGYANLADSLDPNSLPFQVMKMMTATHADSVQPLVDAGLVDLVSSTHALCPGIVLMPTPGHSPGHVSVHIQSQGETAIITGDCIHHPIQIAFPALGTSVDTNIEQGVETRRLLLDFASSEKVLLIGSHFSNPSGVCVSRCGTAYRVDVSK